jgi:hypothetical protein
LKKLDAVAPAWKIFARTITSQWINTTTTHIENNTTTNNTNSPSISINSTNQPHKKKGKKTPIMLITLQREERKSP